MLVCRRRPSGRKKSRKSEKKTSSTFFSFDRHHRHFPEALRDVAVRAPCGHRGPPIRYTACRVAYTRATPTRLRLYGQHLCFGGRFRRVKKRRLYFRDFFPGFFSLFHPTRTILREFWTFRRPQECGPSLHNLPPPLFFFSLCSFVT